MAITEPSTSHPAPQVVLNQPPPLVAYNLYAEDRALREGIARVAAGWADTQLMLLGERAGTEEAIAWGFAANVHPPQLRSFDRFGHRIDEVEFHPAWHNLMRIAVAQGLHASPWRGPRPGAHAARAAGFYLWSQVEAGHGCPISMTYAAVPALRRQPEIAAVWESRITALVYDPGLRPLSEKRGILCGMAMTEKQGGSDLRANTTVAQPVAASGPGAAYRLTGHKWFCSAPMCDIFLVLAQAPGGLACFLLPRILPDGTRNRIFLQRLKEKLGNRANASSEIELEGATAYLIGAEGRGVATIAEMVNSTRLDCVIGTASAMRQAVAQATHHATYRTAFGHPLLDQPLMRNVLADLALESEAATVLMLRLASAADQAESDVAEAALKRLGTAIAKFAICKRGPALAAEALECLGGNGYIEECIMPRLYREMPLNSIWEGAGNVICLDTLRALRKEPAALPAFLAEVERGAGRDPHLDAALDQLRRDLADPSDIEVRARRLVNQMALVWQASLLHRHSPAPVAAAFAASRLGAHGGAIFGTLPAKTDFMAIIDRARPRLG